MTLQTRPFVAPAVTAGSDPRRGGAGDDGRGTRRGHLRVLSSDS